MAAIKAIRTHVCNIPLEAPYAWAPGYYTGATKTIIEVETTDGVIGLGEVHGAAAARTIEEYFAPKLIGQNAADHHSLEMRALPPLETVKTTDPSENAIRCFGGIEIALWDIRAREQGRPLYEVLGGAVRTEIAFSEYFSARLLHEGHGGEQTPVTVASYCARMVEEHGSSVFEGKVGFADAAFDIAMVREVRAAIGNDRVLRLDANMGWELSTAVRVLRHVEAYDVSNVEDPAPTFDDMARLREHTAIPFSTHVADLRSAVRLGTPDTFVLSLTTLGGIRRTIAFINACAELGRQFWFYSGDTAVATAGYLHVSAALPALRHPHQSLLRWQTDDVVASGVFRPEGGTIRVPDGPGLGVELDKKSLQRAKERYRLEGSMEPFGLTPEGVYRRVPRY